jgi:hypothetical protein
MREACTSVTDKPNAFQVKGFLSRRIVLCLPFLKRATKKTELLQSDLV